MTTAGRAGDVERVLGEHRQFGGGCTGCDWMSSNLAKSLKDDHRAHLAAVIALVVAGWLGEAWAEAWDECVRALAWCLDNGHPESAPKYLLEHNPWRALRSAGGDGEGL